MTAIEIHIETIIPKTIETFIFVCSSLNLKISKYRSMAIIINPMIHRIHIALYFVRLIKRMANIIATTCSIKAKAIASFNSRDIVMPIEFCSTHQFGYKQ